MTVPLISIVMPAFNADKHIQSSVECILHQTIKDIELIIVDDHSTDNTWEIISKIANEDSRCRIFRLENNSGSAKYPRDYAVMESRGEFICWIDADDIISEDYIERLIKRQKITHADIVCSKMVAFDENNNIIYTLPAESFNHEQIIGGREAVMYTIGTEWTINVNGFLAKKQLWCSTKHFLNRDVAQMNADDYASREMLLNSKIVAFDEAEYHYRLHSQSITKAISHKLFEPLITDKMVIDLFCKEFGNNIQTRQAWSQYFSHWISMMRIFVLRHHELSTNSRNISISLLKEHKKFFDFMFIFRCKELSIQQKLLLLLPFNVAMFIIKRVNS